MKKTPWFPGAPPFLDLNGKVIPTMHQIERQTGAVKLFIESPSREPAGCIRLHCRDVEPFTLRRAKL